MKVQKPYLQEKHVESVNRKYMTLRGKCDLLATWEAVEQKNGYDEETHKIVLNLRKNIRNIRNCLRQMDHTLDF